MEQTMGPARLAEALEVLRWSQRGLAAVLDLPDSTIRGWLAGRSPVPAPVAAWLEALAAAHEKNPPPRAFRA